MRSKRPSHKGLLEEVESFMAEHGIFRDDASSQVIMHIERFFQGGTSLLYLVVSSSAPKHVTYTRPLSAASSHVLLPGTCEETLFERISFQRRHRQSCGIWMAVFHVQQNTKLQENDSVRALHPGPMNWMKTSIGFSKTCLPEHWAGLLSN